MLWIALGLAALSGIGDEEGFLDVFEPGRSALEARLEPHVRALNDGNAQRRRAAVDAVIDWGTFDELRRSLVRKLDEKGAAQVRRSLLFMLAGLRDPESLELLNRNLGKWSDEEEVVVALGLGLGSTLTPEARKTLEALALSENRPRSQAAVAAVLALGRARSAESVEVLRKIERLARPDAWEMRRQAAALFSRALIGDQSAGVTAIAILSGKHGDQTSERILRLGAWLTLAHLGEGRQMPSGLDHSFLDVARSSGALEEQMFAALALGAHQPKDKSLKYLESLYADAKSEVLLTVLPVLERIEPTLEPGESGAKAWINRFEKLTKMPEERAPQIAATAARVLGQDAVPYLMRLLQAKQPDLQSAALLGLARLESAEGKDTALAVVRNDRSNPRLIRSAWLYLAVLARTRQLEEMPATPMPDPRVEDLKDAARAYRFAQRVPKGQIAVKRLNWEIAEAEAMYAPSWELQRHRLDNRFGLWCLFGVQDPRLIKTSVVGQEPVPTAGQGAEKNDGDNTGGSGNSGGSGGGYNASGSTPKTSRLQSKSTLQEDLEAWFLVSKRPYFEN